MERIGILAITKNGIKIAKDLKEKFSSWEIFAPDKFSDMTMRLPGILIAQRKKLQNYSNQMMR